ncbi:beta-1,3-glucanase family protein [Piscinibacter terrae]|uniref:GH64 domain-containing protein n=1 Tax=Piscinibacter terrae TaxID=2496871 RepID=A0A3N7HN36_9BURK|nr:beta-1,3-glucanase family protein [Albitalea terrae]RQP22506.1 hypothetical protein DZC73_23060 [Albitalea terrae]
MTPHSSFTQGGGGGGGGGGGTTVAAPSFNPPGGSYAGIQSVSIGYIDQVWNQYTAADFVFTRPGDTFRGRVVAGRLQFTWNGAGPFFIDKPTTFDVFGCTGYLAKGSTMELALEAGFCGAFNRGVAHNTANWHTPASYYQNGVMQNEYAHFWHVNGINGKAYAFAYDDANDQSSVIIIPNLAAKPYPDSVTITVGW